ncbi:hypothetical protein MOQ_003116 [Trypanosoma cruzi marinkellei]|uniref:Uncharacterized protein n=1 Tax=Trypanosoma cruzi marinkellei TaxID=85056 RepID=K2NVQ3_TRYCR|nr:hypothetical protein MOQ_003116 [Trypanosoma cruzi marinkellei]
MVRGRRASPAVAASSSSSSSSSKLPPGKKGGRKLPVVKSTSIAAALRQASCDSNESAVILRGKAGVGVKGQGACTADVQSHPQGSRLRLQQSTPQISFWKGICRPTLLVQALAKIGTLVEAETALLFANSQVRYPFSALTVERVLTAIQAIVDAAELLRTVGADDNRAVFSNSAMRQRWGVIRKLIELAEAAVPMKVSLLASCTTAGESSTAGVPPVSLWALNGHLKRLQRLLQLRECHSRIISTLRLCKTKNEVSAALFGPSMIEAATIEPMPGVAYLHQGEQCVIKGLLAEVNDIAPCSESWGPSSITPLRVASGSYVLHKHSRFETLACLLKVAEFIGLPPFLRSIRVAGGRSRVFQPQPSKMNSMDDGSLHIYKESLPFLFPSSDDLDPRHFETPASNQAQLVQEELVKLASQHCCFGALVGEADQVVALLHESAACLQRRKMASCDERTVTIKIERAEDDDEGRPLQRGMMDASGKDPLRAYAQWLLQAAKEENSKQNRVRWLCGNRWSPTMSYYALVIAATLPHNTNDVVEAEEDSEAGDRADFVVSYYVAAVLELTRF